MANIEEKLIVWKNYVGMQEKCSFATSTNDSSDITRSEFEGTILAAKDFKSINTDEIHIEVMMVQREDHSLFIQVDLFNRVYKIEIIQMRRLRSALMALPERSWLKCCEHHKTILKLFR